MAHTCYSAFWGDAAVDLVTILDTIARGDARKMKQHTYWTLCVVQREIERATGFPASTIPAHIGPPMPPLIPDDQEALLRATAQQFLAGLVADQFDSAAPGHHGARFLQPLWMSNAGAAEPNALVTLTSIVPPPPPPPPPPPFPPLDCVLGRVRNALDS
jgi:hypothetical protein